MTDSPLSSAKPSRHPFLGVRLSTMMFLQYAVWGAWLPVLGRYLSAEVKPDGMGGLGFSGSEIGLIIGTAGAVGAITAPFIAGQVADRFFSAERFMFVLFIVGGIIKYLMADMTSFSAWMIWSVVYSIIYMPTIAISNGIAFAHLKNPDRQFGPIRLWGTIGWIVISWVFPLIWLQKDVGFKSLPPYIGGEELENVVPLLADALKLSGILSVAYGLFCLSLPHTPPKKSVEKLAFAKAFALLRHRGLLVVTLVALPISATLTLYFIHTPSFLATLDGVRDADIGPAMTIAQISEVLILGLLGLILAKMGFRWTLALGAFGYFLRFAIFALGAPTWLVVSSQVLHGFCYACFYVCAFMYVERVAPADVRHSAQTTFAIVLFGLGPLLAAPIGNFLDRYAVYEATVQECMDRGNMVPQVPADDPNEPESDPKGWDNLYVGANEAVEAYAADEANVRDKGGAWKALRPETTVEKVKDYRYFWFGVSLIGLFGTFVIALLFKLDPAATNNDEEDQAPAEGGAT